MLPGDIPKFFPGIHNPVEALNDLARRVGQLEGMRFLPPMQEYFTPAGTIVSVAEIDPHKVEVLKIQSGAANSFGYPARVQKWDNSAGTWSDLNTTEVRVEDPNGGTFAAGAYVAVTKYLGKNTSDVDCYSGAVLATSSSGYEFVGTYTATASISNGTASGWTEARTVFSGLSLNYRHVLLGYIRVNLLLNSVNTEVSESWLFATTSGSGTISGSQYNENRVPTGGGTVAIHTLTVATYAQVGGSSDGIKITPTIHLATGTFNTSSVDYDLHLWRIAP